MTISFSMRADQFVRVETLMILCLGLVAFVLDTVVGVLFVKALNLFMPRRKINPMIGRRASPPSPCPPGSSKNWARRPTTGTTC